MKLLNAPVGPGKANKADDVKVVQHLLNARGNSLNIGRLIEDGCFGPKTQEAIVTFQKMGLKWAKADGVVDPGGKTAIALAQPRVKKPPEHVTAFITMALPAAQAVQIKWGVPASVLIAQAALESGWGRHVKDNAYFGIKGKSESANRRRLQRMKSLMERRFKFKTRFGLTKIFRSRQMTMADF